MNERERTKLKKKLKSLQSTKRNKTIFEPLIEHILEFDERLTKLEGKND